MSVLKITIQSLDESLLSRRALIDILSQNYSSIHNAEIVKKKKSEDGDLSILFPSFEEYKNTFSRSIPLSEKFLVYFRNSPFSEIKFQYKHTNPPNPSKNYVFLTLKLESAHINIVRDNYNFTFQVANLMGVGVAYEEIEGGIIIFYKLKQDFDFVQIDKTNFEEVLIWMKENMTLKKIHFKFFQELFSLKE